LLTRRALGKGGTTRTVLRNSVVGSACKAGNGLKRRSPRGGWNGRIGREQPSIKKRILLQKNNQKTKGKRERYPVEGGVPKRNK